VGNAFKSQSFDAFFEKIDFTFIPSSLTIFVKHPQSTRHYAVIKRNHSLWLGSSTASNVKRRVDWITIDAAFYA